MKDGNFGFNPPEILNFENIDISSNLSAGLWCLFSLAMVIFVIISIILLYHWRTYGTNNKKIVLAEVIYLVVSAILIVLSLSFLSAV